jgi:hypothetical protein
MESRKVEIEGRFHSELIGLLVDISKPGSGTTDNGDSTRRLFHSFSVSSSITGINEELIKHFATICMQFQVVV